MHTISAKGAKVKKRMYATLLASLFLAPGVAAAQDTSTGASSASPHSLSANFSLVSDYRFRGISQTDKKPGIQGGFDYSHASGFYVGNWNASVTTDSYNGGAGLEMDFYAGFKPTYKDFTFDIGVLQYNYPGAKIAGSGQRYDTTELYAGVEYGPVSFKTWYGISNDWFGSDDAKGSLYYELNGSYPLSDKLSLVAHVGYQDVNDTSDADYWDYKLGVEYSWRQLTFGAAVVGVEDDDDFYGRYGDTTVVLSVGASF